MKYAMQNNLVVAQAESTEESVKLIELAQTAKLIVEHGEKPKGRSAHLKNSAGYKKVLGMEIGEHTKRGAYKNFKRRVPPKIPAV